MGVNFSDGIFHLQTDQTSYAFALAEQGILVHMHWGQKVRSSQHFQGWQARDRAFSPPLSSSAPNFSLDTAPQEFPTYGCGDFRAPSIEVQSPDGSTVGSLRYHEHRVTRGKRPLLGLPATYVEDDAEAETLEVELHDTHTGLCATLSYSVFPAYDVITRSVRLHHGGTSPLTVRRLLSASVDLPAADFSFLHLSGAWARERHIVRAPLRQGTQSIESRRGTSSHQHNPFFALLAPGADENRGEVYGFNLVYSGNFLGGVEVDQFDTARAQIGLNPFDFAWRLEPGEEFQAPEAVLVFSAEGLGGISCRLHRLYRQRLCRGAWRDRPRPVLLNNWEATYFDFDADKIEAIAHTGRQLGVELFVLDDGWFGRRDDDRSSLGDWIVDRRKLPEGLEDLGKRITREGMAFGLWLEPEMISPDSELYRAHPDWCLHVPGRERTTSRHQLVLDLSRADVCGYLIDAVSAVLASAPITYVKWDMNRHLTEVGSASLPPERQRETAHRYVLGLYRVLEEITRRFPQVLFESCSGGGGRFDPGMLFYMPQTWASDNSDAISRLKIQYGTSLAYPLSSIGAHVSAVPNHQVHRTTTLETRGLVAMSGNFGYELDLGRLTAMEQAEVRGQIELYKQIRELVQTGDQYRLRNPFERNEEAAWMVVNAHKTEAVCFYFRVLAEANAPLRRLRLRGLDPEREYQRVGSDECFGGDLLMAAGIYLPESAGDFRSVMWHFRVV